MFCVSVKVKFSVSLLERSNLLFYYYVFVCILFGKAVPEMTYTVSGGTLSSTHSLSHFPLNYIDILPALYKLEICMHQYLVISFCCVMQTETIEIVRSKYLNRVMPHISQKFLRVGSNQRPGVLAVLILGLLCLHISQSVILCTNYLIIMSNLQSFHSFICILSNLLHCVPPNKNVQTLVDFNNFLHTALWRNLT